MTPTSGEKTASLREDELHGECRSNRAIVSLIMSFASLAHWYTSSRLRIADDQTFNAHEKSHLRSPGKSKNLSRAIRKPIEIERYCRDWKVARDWN
jgi:hypothetical protein